MSNKRTFCHRRIATAMSNSHDRSDNNKKHSPSPSLWLDLPRRVATIAIGFPIIVIILSHRVTAYLFFLGVHLLCCIEWIRLQQSKANGILDFVLFATLSLVTAHLPHDLTAIGLLLSISVLFLYQFPSPTPHSLFGMVFLSIPMSAWYRLAPNFRHTISLLLIVWNCDTGALLVGRIHKSIPMLPPSPTIPYLQTISPAKSVSGIMGGFVFGVLTTVCIPWLWRNVDNYYNTDNNNGDGHPESYWDDHTVQLGIVLSISAIFGDLVESAVKRTTGQKDSSKLLPGHGGILDRFDSSLFAVVLYNYYIVLPTIVRSETVAA